MHLIEHLFPYALFLFLASAFLAAAATRPESRLSLLFSKISFYAGLATAAVILVSHLWSHRALALSNSFDGILFSILILGAVYLITEMKFAFGIAPGLMAAVCLLLGFIALFFKPEVSGFSEVPAGKMGGHTLFMFLALSAYSLSFIVSILYLVQNFLLKKKQINALFFRLPSLELTSRLNFAFLTVGTTALFGGVLGGLYYLRTQSFQSVLLKDFTVLFSLWMLALYAAILMLKGGPLEKGRRVAYVSIAAYALLLISFLTAHHPGGMP